MDYSGPVEQERIKRQVNDGIERGLWPGEDEDVVRMRCECGRFDCTDFLDIRVSDYEWVRDDGRRFLLSLGHDMPQIEQIVRTRPRYIVVEKIGKAGRRAEASDPRDPGTEASA
jgi:hypothetical protein